MIVVNGKINTLWEKKSLILGTVTIMASSQVILYKRQAALHKF